MQKLLLLTLGISLTALTGLSTAGLVTVTPLIGSHRFADDTLSPSQTINDATQYGIALSYYPASTWGWEVGLSRASTDVGLSDSLDWKSGDVSIMRRFYTYQAIQPYLLAGIGQAHYHSETLTTENSSYGQLGAGVMWNINDLLALRTEVRALSLQKTSSVDYVGFLGLEFACGCMGSTYYERRHRVHAPDPIIPKAAPVITKVAVETPVNPPSVPVALLPKPAVILDADGDGINDDADKCENTPPKTKVNANGCPLVTDGDDDKDGVKNSLDKCVNTPANTKVDEKGCPFANNKPNNGGNGNGGNNGNNNGGNKSGGGSTTTSGNAGAPININVTNNNNNYNDGKLIPNDNDQDGVTDDQDKCPNSPAKSKVDDKGCPVISPIPTPTPIVDADKDQDGVLDSVDKCLNTPKGVKVDATGCTLALTEDIAINLHVLFATNKAIIINKAMTDIQKVAEFMRNYPDVTMTVEGHTDDRASAEHNLLLSKKRAQAVKRELVKTGIRSSRLRAVGYGESQPIADNATEEGRVQNRRVVATAKYKK